MEMLGKTMLILNSVT